jgi:hypothetical protein
MVAGGSQIGSAYSYASGLAAQHVYFQSLYTFIRYALVCIYLYAAVRREGDSDVI